MGPDRVPRAEQDRTKYYEHEHEHGHHYAFFHQDRTGLPLTRTEVVLTSISVWAFIKANFWFVLSNCPTRTGRCRAHF